MASKNLLPLRTSADAEIYYLIATFRSNISMPSAMLHIRMSQDHLSTVPPSFFGTEVFDAFLNILAMCLEYMNKMETTSIGTETTGYNQNGAWPCPNAEKFIPKNPLVNESGI